MNPAIPPILATPEITADSLLPLLRTRVLGRRVHAFGRCDSTNRVARHLLESRGPDGLRPIDHGALIVTDHQNAGRGRNGRSWVSSPGGSLLFTLILNPDLVFPDDADRDPEDQVRALIRKSGLVTMAAAVAVVRAVRVVGGPLCPIKWPNDVLAPDGRKLSGILTERVVRPDDGAGLVCGIGVNVNQAEEDFPPELRESAASVRMLKGGEPSRLRLLAELLGQFELLFSLPEADVFNVWKNLCVTIGKTVRVRLHDRVLRGQALGVEEDGRLILRDESGQLECVSAGDVEELRGVPVARPCSMA
jgi:BirA family biotin operon repressor/biotin-[acetyl-CoA-carboxylase] ligase